MARRRRRTRSQPGPAPELPPFLRRRSTLWLAAALITLAVGVLLAVISSVTGGDDDGAGTGAPTPTLAVALPAIEPDPADLIEADVVDVIDGDTIDVRVPSLRSGQGGREERVRYYGVDTPERGDDCFDEATERNEALAGERVLLLPDARERDPFDRLLRYVFTEDGASVEARLIAEGLGRAWREDGTYRDGLVALEADARSANAGCLWAGG